uniref:Putative secreted protein n=1 Tax=Anopheles darlingi TaxID=43151 RepID=A0A2M4DPQ7_ANODA
MEINSLLLLCGLLTNTCRDTTTTSDIDDKKCGSDRWNCNSANHGLNFASSTRRIKKRTTNEHASNMFG